MTNPYQRKPQGLTKHNLGFHCPTRLSSSMLRHKRKPHKTFTFKGTNKEFRNFLDLVLRIAHALDNLTTERSITQ